jgi:hypothetical protein
MEQLNLVMKDYFQYDDQIQEIEATLRVLKEKRDALLPAIQGTMASADVDEICVRNFRFNRVKRVPKKKTVKDDVLRNVLVRHIGGEDGKVRAVLEDLAQHRAPPPGQDAPKEVLVRRKIVPRA